MMGYWLYLGGACDEGVLMPASSGRGVHYEMPPKRLIRQSRAMDRRDRVRRSLVSEPGNPVTVEP